MFYCNILLQINIIGNQTAFATPPPSWDNKSINSYFHISFISGVFSQAQKIGAYIKMITPASMYFSIKCN